jgi:signal transduction histidine kinase
MSTLNPIARRTSSGPPDADILVGGATAGSVPAAQHPDRLAQAAASDEARGFSAGERLRIAGELHDVASYSFATIGVQAGVAAHVAHRRPEQAKEALRAIDAISREACRELRGIVGLLRTPGSAETPSQGLGRLRALAATTASAGLPTRVVVSGRTDRPSPAVAAAAYRIVQEALTNALRHAGPAAASVFVTCGPDQLIIEVVDDGCGLTEHARARPPGSGHGIAGMRERAHALGGLLDAGPGPEGGFRVRASLPNGGQS